MFETMYDAPGIGLAASQVDVHQRFMVMDVTEDKSRPLVFINPEITARDGDQVYQEGCLSVPGIFADVTRANEITVQALDRDGQPFELQADGLLAVCIQHEMDHLIGKLFVDYLSPLKREMVRKKLAKQRKLARRRGLTPDGPCASSSPARRISPCPRLRAAAQRNEVVAVYTQPDRPAGRGRELTPSPVKREALQRGIDGAAAGDLQGRSCRRTRCARCSRT